MEPRDVSSEINQVAQHYQFAEQPEFVRAAIEWIGRTIRWLYEFWRDLFRHEGSSIDSQGMSSVLQVMVWVVGIAGLIMLCVALVRRAKQLKQKSSAGIRGASAVEELLDADGWKRQAAKLAAANDYKSACRAVYLSLLQDMHERGIAEFAPARTNYEYGYALAKHPEIQREFKAMAARVETIWFGNRIADDSDYDDSMRQLDALENRMKILESERLKAEALVQS